MKERNISVGQRLPLVIERLVFQGNGLGHLADGRVVFVPYTAPGDEAEVEVTEAREDYVRAKLLRILTPAAVRIGPPCRYFQTCGGCHWQHLSDASQLEWKQKILGEQLTRVGKLTDIPVSAPVAPVGPWEYRGRAQFKVFAGGRLQIGFHQQETHRVVDIDRCPLLDARLNRLLSVLRRMRDPALPALFPRLREVWVAVGTGTGETIVSLFARTKDRAAIRLLFHRIQAEVSALQGVVLLDGDPRQHPRFVDRHGHGAIVEQVGAHRFRVDAMAFFQVSGLAAETLTHLVIEGAALTGTERVMDLFCGVGTFSVPLARLAKDVIGVEASAVAASDALHNLRTNACANARIIHTQVEQALPGLAQEGPWDLAVLDPPRQGVSGRVLGALLEMGVPRLVYVSCDPTTLARDLGVLVHQGYRCVRLTPVELFPQTFHLEAVAVLERR